MDDWVTIGRIVKPHGIHGELVVQSLSDLPDRIAPGVLVLLVPGPAAPVAIAACRPHQGRLLVRLAEVSDRNDAEALRGRELRAAPVDLDDQETFFAHELVGLPVLSADGEDLGRVTALIDLPDAAGYDLLEVTHPDGHTWLLPAVDAYVEVVVDEGDRLSLVVGDAPAGLLELGQDQPRAASRGDRSHHDR